MLRLFVLFCLLNTAHISTLFAATSDHSIILADGPLNINLQNNIQWLKADHNSLSLGQLQLNNAPEFKDLKTSPIIEHSDTYWVRFHIINPSSQSLTLALQLSDNTLIVESAYNLSQKKWQRIKGFEKNQRLTGHTALQLNFQGNVDQWVYLRVSSGQTSKLNPKLMDLNHYSQQLGKLHLTLGAMLALLAFTAVLHLTAIRFHNHVRHYLVVYMAMVAFLYGLSHLPLTHWPIWLDKLCNLMPWGLACGVAFSAFNTQSYQLWIKSNRAIFSILSLFLASLVLFNLNYLFILFASLPVCVFALIRSKNISLKLSISTLLLSAYIIWHICYLFWPKYVLPTDGLINIYSISACIFFASMNMLMPYFQRQTLRNTPSNNKPNNEFLSLLSHELRSPMNGVLGMSELLSETPLSHTQKDYVDTITLAGQDILRMIDRMSYFAKINSNRLQIESKPCDLAQLMEDILPRFQAMASQKSIELVLNFNQDIPNSILIDVHYLQSLIDYLLENAFKHTEQGEVELRINWNNPPLKQDLLFSIRDTGKGMRKEKLNNIFNRSEPIDNTNHVQFNGLAISLSKRIVNLMGGDMYVDSTPEVGTTFSFSLPYQAVTEESNTQDKANLLPGMSMLIVDDNSTLRKVIQRYAKSWGMHADCTYSGKEALAMLRSQSNLKNPYDIILIDQDMPIMDGFQLAKRIQEDHEINQNLLKVMLTGLAIPSNHQNVIQSGIHQVINKPVSARVLQQVLSQRIQQKIVMKSARPQS